MSTVDVDLLEISKDVCKANGDIGRFGITPCNLSRLNEVVGSFEHKNEQINIVQTSEVRSHLTYKLSGCWSIWNREYFLLYLNRYDNLWQWEINGSEKSLGDGWRVVTTSKSILTYINIWKRGTLRANWTANVWDSDDHMDEDDIIKITQIFNL